MSLTPAQLATLKADIAASSDMNSLPLTNTASIAIAELYNAASTTDVWRTDASVTVIEDAIDRSKFTPADSMPAADAASGNALIHQSNGRLLLIQTKQMNLQWMQGRTTIDASKPLLRSGIRDATIALPAGVNGASISASGVNGVNVLNAMVRKASRFEKLFAGADSTTGPVTAKLLVVEGAVSSDDVQTAREMV